MTTTLAQPNKQNILTRTRNAGVNIIRRTSNKIFDLLSLGKKN